MATKPRLALRKSYLAAIENSIGSKLFRNQYYRIGGKVIDVFDNGDLSCAVYVTTILYLFGLIKARHATIKSTIEDMEKSGWRKIRKPRKGAVILWDFKKNNDGTQKSRHVGFYVDTKTAISNSSSLRVIAQHHLTFGTFPNGEARRGILAYYWNNKLNA